MKKLLLFILIASSSLFGENFSEQQGQMEEANLHFQNKEYRQAAEIYEQITGAGFMSAKLYYNLGNAYFRLDEIGKAILNYERAARLDPGDEDIAYNLEIARTRTVDRINEVPQIFLVRWWEILVTLVPVSTWALLTVLFYILLIIVAAFYLTARRARTKRFAFFFSSPVLVVLVFSASLLIASYERANSFEEGVLMESSISVKSSPDNESGDEFVIHKGIKFKIEDQLNDWAKIRLADGKIGWLPQNAFEKI